MSEEFIVTVALAGLVTLGLKSAFIEGQHYFTLPKWFVEALEFVPSAVLCALIVPSIFKGDLGLIATFGPVGIDPKPIAALIAAITFFTTKKTISTLTAGMASLYLVYWLQL
jgi:branched-subunit amino acid transport protein